MSSPRFAAIVLVALAAFAATRAEAQNASASATLARDPGDAKAAVPAVMYTSAFARYRPNAEVEVGDWRESNDNVGRIGGWRVYGREAIDDPKAAERPARAVSPKPAHGQGAK
jgi:hypothetical protein